MKFIRTNNGKWIDTSRVARFVADAEKGWRLEDESGSTLGFTVTDPEDVGAPIIPAAAGAMATVIEESQTEKGGVRLTTFRYPIIAWQIAAGVQGRFVATPILPEPCLGDTATILVETPSGFVHPSVCEFKTLKAALQQARVDLKMRQDLRKK